MPQRAPETHEQFQTTMGVYLIRAHAILTQPEYEAFLVWLERCVTTGEATESPIVLAAIAKMESDEQAIALFDEIKRLDADLRRELRP